MNSDIAMRVSNLSKSYVIRQSNGHRPTNLGEAIRQQVRNPFRRAKKEQFWALRDIELDINEGEVVGIIGHNGAGKSTLLKVLSRITEPTTGRIELYGRIASLLEVGTGFHPELSGRENIYLNGAILGMTRSEITKQFDAIVDFAEVERFLDTPVKRYSSGMYVRLAFAVAAHLNPEILIVDEVLAVGDVEFQNKCLGKMQDVARSGRTVLFVSHNLDAVRRLCSRGVLLNKGRIQAVGSVADVLKSYDSDHESNDGSNRFPIENPVTGVSLRDAQASLDIGDDSVSAEIRLSLLLRKQVNNLGIGISLTSEDGVTVSRLYPKVTRMLLGKVHGEAKATVYLDSLEHSLCAGNYDVGISLHEFSVSGFLLQAERIATLSIPGLDVYQSGFPARSPSNGFVPLQVRAD